MRLYLAARFLYKDKSDSHAAAATYEKSSAQKEPDCNAVWEIMAGARRLGILVPLAHESGRKSSGSVRN